MPHCTAGRAIPPVRRPLSGARLLLVRMAWDLRSWRLAPGAGQVASAKLRGRRGQVACVGHADEPGPPNGRAVVVAGGARAALVAGDSRWSLNKAGASHLENNGIHRQTCSRRIDRVTAIDTDSELSGHEPPTQHYCQVRPTRVGTEVADKINASFPSCTNPAQALRIQPLRYDMVPTP